MATSNPSERQQHSHDRRDDKDRQGRDHPGSSSRGFAGMDHDRQREIAAEGGRAAHASGHAHEFDSEEAREAGSQSHGGHSGSHASERDSSHERTDASKPSTRGDEPHAKASHPSHKNDR